MSSTNGGLNIVTNGLVFYLDAANSNSYISGSTTCKDLSKISTNGTLINGPTYSPSNGGQFITDGIDDYITFGNVPILNFTTPFSIGCWFKAAAVQPAPDSALMGNISTQGIYSGYILWYNSTTVDFYFNSAIRANSSTIITADTWYNVMAVWTGTQAILYLNGVLNVSSAYAFPPGNGSPSFTVGAYQPNRCFKGSIASAVAYNRALSDLEIQQNYNTTKTRFGL